MFLRVDAAAGETACLFGDSVCDVLVGILGGSVHLLP